MRWLHNLMHDGRWLHPAFLFSLLLLGINDHMLKALYPGFFTGKLSDFAGLFAFAWFGSLVTRQALWSNLLSTILWLFWKSELSTPFVEAFSHSFFLIQRVVDVSDRWAVVALPISYRLYQATEIPSLRHRRGVVFLIAILCLFLFCATSLPQASYILLRNKYKVSQASIDSAIKVVVATHGYTAAPAQATVCTDSMAHGHWPCYTLKMAGQARPFHLKWFKGFGYGRNKDSVTVLNMLSQQGQSPPFIVVDAIGPSTVWYFHPVDGDTLELAYRFFGSTRHRATYRFGQRFAKLVWHKAKRIEPEKEKLKKQ